MSTSSSSSAPSEASRRHSHRKTQARAQLAGVMMLLIAAFGVVLSFAVTQQCRARWPEMIGVLFGSSVAMTLLLGAVWGRQNWARCVLIIALVLLSVVFGLYLLAMMTNPVDANGPGFRALSVGVVCLLGAAGWLTLSKRIRYLTTPAGSGSRA